jgi:hypothetical protein
VHQMPSHFVQENTLVSRRTSVSEFIHYRSIDAEKPPFRELRDLKYEFVRVGGPS